MRSETNHLKSEHQERSKQQSDRKKDGSMSPTYNSNQRRSSASDDDISSLQPLKNGPNENTADVDNDDDDENENYDGEGEEYVSDTDYLVQWTGPRKNMPVVLFRADAILEKESSAKCVGEKYRLAFKIVRTECKIVRSVLVSHGFHEVHPNSLDFNVMWTGSHIKPYVLRGFSEFQKVNHFPRSYELTRKDRLCKNLQRMQHLKGFKHFDFIPLTFITPIEYSDFQSTFVKEKGIWIVKPVASSRGRGIFLINHPSQVPMDETLIVSRYISNPLLIDDFKFDIRLYVLITSYDPMIVYLYEEGLARFASQKFDKSAKSVKNQFMHLTNYSVNKRNPDFVKNADPELEDYGNKWSMSAMLRYLKSIGHDTAALMMRIEDLIIKTFVAGEMAIASASNMFQPYRGNCFELYGFDVLVDENMKPWLMEVNLSPSLACDAPIDLKIKANMVSDLFSVVGVTAQDPVSRRLQLRRGGSEAHNRNAIKQQIVEYIDNFAERSKSSGAPPLPKRKRAKGSANSSMTKKSGGAPFSGTGGRKNGSGSRNQSGGTSGENLNPLTNEEAKILRLAREEYGRRGRWIRIFPTPTSMETYGGLMEHRTTHNLMLFTRLFPNGRTKAGSSAPSRPSSAYPSSSSGNASNHRPRSAAGMAAASKMNSTECNETTNGCSEIIGRLLQYERRLMTLAETRAVSAANGNRRVNSESFALSLAAQNEALNAGGASRNGSGGQDSRPRSRSRLPQGVDTSQGTGGSSGTQNRKQTRSLSNSTASRTQQRPGSQAKPPPTTGHEAHAANGHKHERVATRNRSSAPDDYRVTEHRHSKPSRPRSETKHKDSLGVPGGRGGHRDRSRDSRTGGDVSNRSRSGAGGSAASYTRGGSRSRSRSGGRTRSRSGSPNSSGSRSRSRSGSSASSGGSSSSSSSSFDSDNDSSRSSSDEMLNTEKAKQQIRNLLEQGHIFTVTQARLAFAAYLVRVHRRLLKESQASAHSHAGTGSSGGGGSLGTLEKELRRESNDKQPDNESSDAQMDLVLRFLKRAAQNLSQVFRVVVPSKKLSIQERRRILAKQLSDFVTIYSKDTQTIRAQEEPALRRQQQPVASTSSASGTVASVKTPIADQIFQQFLEISNENDLEEVLTLFTKINRSASIFLGGIQQSQGQPHTHHHHHHSQSGVSAHRSASLKGPSTHHHHQHGATHPTQSSDISMAATQTSHRDNSERQVPPRSSHLSTNENSTDQSRSYRHSGGGVQPAGLLAAAAQTRTTADASSAPSAGGGGHNEVSRDSTQSHVSSSGKYSTVGLALDPSAGHTPPEALLALQQHMKRPPTGLSGPHLLHDKGDMADTNHTQQRDKSVERRDRSVEREFLLKDNQKTPASPPPAPPVQSRVAFDCSAQTRDQSTSAVVASPSSCAQRSSRLLDRNTRRGHDRGTGQESKQSHINSTSPCSSSGGAPFVSSRSRSPPDPAVTSVGPSCTSDLSSFSSPHSPSLLSYLQHTQRLMQAANHGGTSVAAVQASMINQHSGGVGVPSACGDWHASFPFDTGHCAAVPSSDLYPDGGAGHVLISRPNSSHPHPSSTSSHARNFPPSTKAGGTTPINRGKKPRPFSAHLDQTARIYSENLSRTMIPLNVGGGGGIRQSSSSQMTSSVSVKSEEAINQALQRLAKRQATRQYSATNATGTIFAATNSEEDSSSMLSPYAPHPQKGNASTSTGGPQLQWDSDDHATAYSLVTGVAPSTSYQATPGSTQYEMVHRSQGPDRSQQASSVVCATGGIFSRPGSGLVSNEKHKSGGGGKGKPVVIVKNISASANHSNSLQTISRPSTAKASLVDSNAIVDPPHVNMNGASQAHRQSAMPSSNSAGLAGHEDSPYYSRPTRASSANRRAKSSVLNTATGSTSNYQR